MGKYHPHGDSAIYDTLVRLAQDFSMRYPLVDGHGNFGNIDGYGGGGDALHRGAARPRSRPRCCATSTRTRSTSRRTTTAAAQEPLVLPARFPNLLVNGGSGIAVGMATNIPPHNLREVIDATIAYIDDPDDRRRGADEAHQGPGLPDRRDDPRPRGDPRGVRHRPRPDPGPGQGAHRADRPGQGGDHRHRAARTRCARAATAA